MGEQMKRRRFLAGTGAAAGALAAGRLATPAVGEPAQHTSRAAQLPAPQDSGIDHIIVVMMENRSFDHYLGWLPGADGKQSGLRYKDLNGQEHGTHRLTTTTGCGSPDPDHSFEGGRTELNGGACDGWLRAGGNDTFAIGYYKDADLAFFGQAARDWTVCDRYFSAVMAETYPNRIFQHAAQTDRVHNSLSLASMPTIWDRLADKRISRRYYFSDVPMTALWGIKYLDFTRTYSSFVSDAKAGKLPAVSFVDPRFLAEGTGLSGDDHPHSDIRVGQHFLNGVYEAVTSSPDWERTILVINYDEWGGFFDHVAPPVGPDPRPDLNTGLRGFRVPCLVISPWARSRVAHGLYDHTSVLKMIEWRHGLPPLTVRDAAANNLAEVLDFSSAPVITAPRYNVPSVISPGCLGDARETHMHAGNGWETLRDHAASYGFPVRTAR
ncbi:alkaline phosphatase family protein [Streptomyces sp. NPDC005209]|uniref:alkaline phosphatase family protein n=1 Tax=Streptomyces sp. NPDC005209 TaxID=3156715 RepID=UPI0033A71F89